MDILFCVCLSYWTLRYNFPAIFWVPLPMFDCYCLYNLKFLKSWSTYSGTKTLEDLDPFSRWIFLKNFRRIYRTYRASKQRQNRSGALKKFYNRAFIKFSQIWKKQGNKFKVLATFSTECATGM